MLPFFKPKKSRKWDANKQIKDKGKKSISNLLPGKTSSKPSSRLLNVTFESNHIKVGRGRKINAIQPESSNTFHFSLQKSEKKQSKTPKVSK